MMVIGDRRTTNAVAGGFQSSFFWMMVIGDRSGFSVHRVAEFQSLFFWMLVTETANTSTYPAAYGFNPCSSGCLSGKKVYASGREPSKFQSLFFWMLVIG